MFFNIYCQFIIAIVRLSLLSFIHVFQPNRKSALAFDNKLLKNVCWPLISYDFYHKC